MTTKPATPAIDPQLAQELAALALQLSDKSDPDTRAAFLGLVQKKNAAYQLPPDVAMPQIEKKIESKFKERDQQAAVKETEARLAGQRKGLIDGSLLPGRKYSEEDVKAIEKFMEENGYANYEHAAIIWSGQQKPADAPPEVASQTPWELPKVDNPFDTAALSKRAATKAFDVIREFRQGKVA